MRDAFSGGKSASASRAYYNEWDPYAAAWLRNLILAGLIAPGDVDERDIRDVRPDELRGYTQVHLFAGIGGWPHALRLAGWPDDRPVWTASCPCQPFSASGKRGGFDDERHLWPAVHHLVEQCVPGVVFGEQVASPDGLVWWDLVSSDLEGAGYATAALDICCASLGAPHIRQRLYWVADTHGWDANDEWAPRKQPQWLADAMHPQRRSFGQHGSDGRDGPDVEREETHSIVGACSEIRGLANAPSGGRRVNGHGGEQGGSTGQPERCSHDVGRTAYPEHERRERAGASRERGNGLSYGGAAQWLADTYDARPQRRSKRRDGGSERAAWTGCLGDASGPLHGFWRDADWLYCRDDKWRPVEPGTQPLAHGVPARVGKLRAYGNAISPPVAASFISAYLAA